MTANLFFTSGIISVERFSWLAEVMKYYTTHIYPGSLHYHPRTPTPSFTFFLSGDASYSLVDRRYLRFWEVLFRLPPFRCVFDPRELRIRGLSAEPFKLRSPDQIDTPALNSPGPSFSDIITHSLKNNSPSSAFGFLDLESPHMYRASVTMIDLFQSAVRNELSPEFYGYLDGIYTVHSNQQPLGWCNTINALQEISSSAMKKNLSPLILACSHSSGARGLNTYCGEYGKIVSACSIPTVKIKDLSAIAQRFCKPHPIMSHSSFFISFIKYRRLPEMQTQDRKDPPPLVLFVSHSPYGTEMTTGAIFFALACAHAGIKTRVVFIEDGVFTLVGHHTIDEYETAFNLQELIKATSGQKNLEYYYYIPSFRKRGLKGSVLKCVIPIGPPVVSQMLFQAPENSDAVHQRAMIF